MDRKLFNPAIPVDERRALVRQVLQYADGQLRVLCQSPRPLDKALTALELAELWALRAIDVDAAKEKTDADAT
jgi:hypothetical protein